MPGVRTTHHVKIGDQYYLVRPGSYRKRPAPLFGPRFTTGDPDYNTLAMWQHWVQSCWIGGIGAEEWEDDAMYDYAVGVDTSQHEVMMLSRDVGTTRGSAVDGDQAVREFIIHQQRLFCLSYGKTGTPSKLWRWNGSSYAPNYAWVRLHTFNDACRSTASFADKLFIGDYGPTLIYFTFASDGTPTYTHIDKPASVGSQTPYAMAVYGDRLYVGFGKEIWRLKPDMTWDGSTPFYRASGINYIERMEVHLGFLYMASANGHILRTDGNATFDMWQFGAGERISGMTSYDGRLFIAVADPNDSATAAQSATEGVLYQFSGAAVTELQRWGRENYDVTLGRMRAYNGKLFFGAPSLLGYANGFGVAAYDAREDAVHIFATNRNTVTYAGGTEGINWRVDDVIYYAGHLFISVYGYGIFNTPMRFRDASRYLAAYDTTAAGASASAGNGGTITSSEFDGGTPGMQKLWRSMTIEYDLPNAACSVIPEFSLDKGQTWTALAALTHTGAFRYRTQILLPENTRGPRFQWRLTLRTTNTGFSPFVRSVNVQYLPVPDPNWMWDMTLVLSESQELLDGTIESPDNVAKLAALRSAFRSQSLIQFVEPDGTEWSAGTSKGALIYSMEERIPNIDASSSGALESEVALTLVEAVEVY